jgi:hypothetical protein
MNSRTLAAKVFPVAVAVTVASWVYIKVTGKK